MIDLILNSRVSVNSFYSSVSFVLAYWLFLCAAITGRMCWKNRGRFRHLTWLSDDEWADMALNWGMLVFWTYTAVQQALETYAYRNNVWYPENQSIVVPVYLPLAPLGLAAVLWWMSFQTFKDHYRWWWLGWMLSGLLMFMISLIYLGI